MKKKYDAKEVGGTMKVQENRKRDIRVRTRLSGNEYEDFCHKVEKSRLGKEEYLRRLLLNGKVYTPPGTDYMKLIREVNAIGVNINQIAHIANISGRVSPEALSECERLLNETLTILREGLCGNRESADSG